MSDCLGFDPSSWDALLARCADELARLTADERSWLKMHLQTIATCQTELDQLFRQALGPQSCTLCNGRCCDCGRHHFTLTNLLGYLLQDRVPPRPDAARPCPFLGEQGCILDAPFRPFNCVTFICDEVETGLDASGLRRFYQLEKRLRTTYEEIAARYPAASLRGLLLALERVGEQSLLKSPATRE